MKRKKIIILEEIFNSITHGIGALASIVGLILIIVFVRDSNMVKITSFIIFGTSLIFMYLMSTLFHSLFFTKAKKIFYIFDKSSIFLLIAGTYTPLILMLLHGWINIGLLLMMWGVAIAGIVFSAIFPNRYTVFSVFLYLLMGWIGVFILHPILVASSLRLVLLLVGGGILYTMGVGFYAWNKLPFNHTIWHLFVLGGSFCHFLFIYNL